MDNIVLKITYPSSNYLPEYKLINSHQEKQKYKRLLMNQLKVRAGQTNKKQVIKLDFIYPDDVETFVYEA
ncbi:hypothetical protein [Macrococcus sp. DPC7161]|uniref:hypothetical protein n=1 Tax=Macrococcus sp. DPC7161 TaxID=2507060 RepID=UPI00100BD571|nr:hypothetical protein [Macrococcus sp. DPC7161]RXK18262.1 hypothetical protein ER639_06105 [Macrococcus sp. DPC7161]